MSIRDFEPSEQARAQSNVQAIGDAGGSSTEMIMAGTASISSGSPATHVATAVDRLLATNVASGLGDCTKTSKQDRMIGSPWSPAAACASSVSATDPGLGAYPLRLIDRSDSGRR
jgi:hypothetical protein